MASLSTFHAALSAIMSRPTSHMLSEGLKMNEHPGGRFGLNARALASLALFCTGAWLVPSGIALHFASHGGATVWSHLFMSIHNIASLIFVVGGVVHVT